MKADSLDQTANSIPVTTKTSYNRRTFVKSLLAAGTAASLPNLASAAQPSAKAKPNTPHGNPSSRRMQAYNLRVQAASEEAQLPTPDHPDNGDESRYSNLIGNYSKGLPHNNLGEVDQNAYNTYLQALASGAPADFELIPMGCPPPRFRLVNPQSGLAFDLEGVDSHATFMPPAPALASAEEAGEIIENYWMALTRDIPFSQYDSDPLTKKITTTIKKLP